jgi:hypothetical protein
MVPMRHRMTGREFGAALQALGLSPLDWSNLVGIRKEKAMRWLHDEETIPSWVPGYCAAMTVPEARALAVAARDRLHAAPPQTQ